MMRDYYGYGLGHMDWFGFGWIFTLVFWALIIWLIVALVHRLSDGHGGYHHGHKYDHEHKDSALDILRERYARGDISKEEFEAKKQDLRK